MVNMEKMNNNKIYFVTSNLNKLLEVQNILKESEIRRINIDLLEIQGTPEQVVIHKLDEAMKHTNKYPILVEDTSLSFDCMSNNETSLPGVYIKWFLHTLGNEGLVKMVQSFENNKATATCVLGLAWRVDGEVKKMLFRGDDTGTIVNSLNDGFGWDPIFKSDENNKTYAEMSIDEKCKISHRAKALEKLKSWLS